MEVERKTSKWKLTLMWSVALLLFYIVSPGPIIWLAQHNYISQAKAAPVLDVIYFPLKWLFENSPAFHDIWTKFRDMWQNLGH
jgi:hypothetical protein